MVNQTVSASERKRPAHDAGSGAVSTPGRLRLRERVGYGLGDLAGNTLFGITGSYLLYFYTDVLMISPAAVALLMLLARFLDALTDPLIGWMIDRRRLFGGQIRPYLKWFAVPLGLFTFLCFLPLDASPATMLAWAYLSYFLLGLVYSLVNVPYGVMANVMTRDRRERVVLGTSRMLGATAGIFAVGAITIPGVRLLGGGDERLGFPLFMALVGIIGAGLVLITWANCKERYRAEPERVALGDIAAMLVRNRPWLICTLVFGLFFVNLTAFYGLSIYYAINVLGQSAAFGGTLISTMGLAKVIGVAASPWAVRRCGQRRTMLVAYPLIALALLGMQLAGSSPALVVAGFALACFFTGVTLPVFYAMISDSIDYGAATTGVRAAGMAYSLNSFVTKLAWAIGGGLSAAMLSWGGYVAGAEQQSATTLGFITFGFVGVPALICAISALLMLAYPRDAVMREAIMALRD